jgi:hypothetical protein
MHKFISFILVMLLTTNAYALEEATPTPSANYSVMIVTKEKAFQKAMSEFIKFDKQYKKSPSKITKKLEEVYYPLLFVEPRYKLFGDLEAPYWMLPLDYQDKLTLKHARLQPSGVLEMWFQLKFPAKPSYPFIVEFHHMAGASLTFTAEAGVPASVLTVPIYKKGEGFKAEYSESGTLQLTVPLRTIAAASPPRAKALRKFLK